MSYGHSIDGVVDRQMLDRQWQVRAANGHMPTDLTDTGAQRCVGNGLIERRLLASVSRTHSNAPQTQASDEARVGRATNARATGQRMLGTTEKAKSTNRQTQHSNSAQLAQSHSEAAAESVEDSGDGSAHAGLPLAANCELKTADAHHTDTTTGDAKTTSEATREDTSQSDTTTRDNRKSRRTRPRGTMPSPARISATIAADPVLTASEVGDLMNRIDTGVRTRQRHVVRTTTVSF